MIPESPIGKRATICGDHPWAGNSGTVDRAEQTIAGWCLVIKLDNGMEAGVFAGKHMKIQAAAPSQAPQGSGT